MRVSMRAAALMLVFAAGPVSAQEGPLLARLDADTRRLVEAVIDTARGAGLPADPLVNKALEGASKGASGARIVAAVRALSHEMGRARAALGMPSEPGELVAGAAALRAGVPAAALARLRSQRPRETVAVYLAVLADLVSAGVPADTAVNGVISLARTAARDGDVLTFRQSVERDIALGAPAGLAAATRVNSTVRAFEGMPGGTTQTAEPSAPPARRRP